MKLLMENWRKYLIEEKEIEERMLPAALAALTALGSPAMAGEMPNTPVEPAQTTQQVDVQETTIDDYNAMIGFINQKIKSDKAKTDVRGAHDIEMEWASLIQALGRARDGNSESLGSLSGKTGANHQALIEFIGEMKDTQQDLYQEYVDMGAAWEITSQGTIRETFHTVNKS